MSVNSYCTSNDSFLDPNYFPFRPYLLFDRRCFVIQPSSFIYIAFFIANMLLLLPFCSFILHLGLQRWLLQRRSTSTSTTTMSHSDILTYHLVVVELISVLGYVFCCCGILMDEETVLSMGFHVWSFTWNGEMFFHMLTCAERYLAVIRPITYRGLRGERGVRIRNVSIGCVWLLCFLAACISSTDVSVFTDFGALIFCLIVTSVGSVSVLRALIRPGPGQRGGNRERVGQSKLRAFYTILLIMAALLVRCAFNLVWVGIVLLRSDNCMLMAIEIWFNLPFSLTLPLLFLHRAGMLACCKNSTE